MSDMTDFLKWALPLQAAKTQEEALYWMKVGHPQESEEELKKEVAELWEERKKLTTLYKNDHTKKILNDGRPL